MEAIDKYRDAEADTAIISGLAALVGCTFYLFSDNSVLLTTAIGFFLSIPTSCLQVYYARSNKLYGRNWSNFANAVISLSLSFSLYFGYGDISAIGGFGAVGLLSVKYWWHTSRLIKRG